MTRSKLNALAVVVLLALVAVGCGDGVTVPESETALNRGAVLFNERCSGCHTLAAAGALGSKPARQVTGGERTNGPNLNTRTETVGDVLYAIRNGGFSGAIMPANLLVGDDAQAVAQFVAEYAGSDN